MMAKIADSTSSYCTDPLFFKKLPMDLIKDRFQFKIVVHCGLVGKIATCAVGRNMT